jgi:RNA polymerase sigma-70 factor (ECF subfamily)
MVDYHRKRTRRSGIPLEAVPEEKLEQDTDTPEVQYLRREERDQLEATLRQLPAQQQEIVRLRFALGLRSKEIARVLQKSEGAVRIILSRALKHLRSIYENE